MRYFLFSILFISTGCSGYKQQNDNKQSQIDTAKLFDPKAQEGKVVESETVLENCLMIEKENIAIVTNGQRKELQNINELKEFLQENSTGIRKQKFYIIYSNNTSAKNVIDIIDIVKAAKIDNYKVLNLQSLFKLDERI